MSLFKNGGSIKERAEAIIRKRVLYATGLGLIPIPVVDVASIFGTQVLMVKEIAELYQVSFDKSRIESIIGIMVGDLATSGIIKSIPGIGSVIGGVTLSVNAAAATYAIGKVFVEHFNQGGNLLSFDPQQSREYFQQLYKNGSLENTPETESSKKLKSNRVSKLWILIIIFIGIITAYMIFVWGNAVLPPTITEEYLNTQVSQPRNVNPAPNNLIEYELNGERVKFLANSTESQILSYINNSESTYPKRFRLDAVQFVGSSAMLSSSGGQRQLKNISLILKNYPDLIIHIYGHTANTGAKLVRQGIGRQRARMLKDILLKYGTEGYRITGNNLEIDPFPGQYEYWGAEIILDVNGDIDANKLLDNNLTY